MDRYRLARHAGREHGKQPNDVCSTSLTVQSKTDFGIAVPHCTKADVAGLACTFLKEAIAVKFVMRSIF
jgi:hypothetical protein